MSVNIHFHILFLDGVYVTKAERLAFRLVPPPTLAALEAFVRVISEWLWRALERQGLLVRDLGIILAGSTTNMMAGGEGSKAA